MESASPTASPTSSVYKLASAAFARAWATTQTKKVAEPSSSQDHNRRLPPISSDRLESSLQEAAPDSQIPDPSAIKDASKPDQTYLYLAYGSNLAASTFQGVRGIKPLAALNVVVPELVMTFDLAGLPYLEPCFANTAYRSPSNNEQSSPPITSSSNNNEKSPLLSHPSYSNPTWPKGLIGVVYEVTPTDYAHIIATEGGGASYHDVLVTCRILLV
ncbi:MAG: hypothetical protein Q9222_007285 [Ikaeria aurantiellina]